MEFCEALKGRKIKARRIRNIIKQKKIYAGHAPEGCNERIGKATVRVMVENLARMLKAIKDDDQMLKWNEELNNA